MSIAYVNYLHYKLIFGYDSLVHEGWVMPVIAETTMIPTIGQADITEVKWVDVNLSSNEL